MYRLIFVFVFLLSLSSKSEEFILGTVKAGVLNVRVQPRTTYTVVAKFARGDKVKVYGERDGWLEVALPDDTFVWIYGEDISNEGIVKRESFLRSGSEVTYAPYLLKAKEGMKLKIIERRKDWVRISPPENLRGWVSAEFIEVPENSLDILKSKKEGKGELDFISLPDKKAVYEGFLTLLKSDLSVQHVLVLDVNGALSPICYLRSDNSDLSLWLNQKVKVSGIEKWVKDWKRPLLIVENVEKLQ